MTGFTFVWPAWRWEVFTESKSLPPCLLRHITLDLPTVSSATLLYSYLTPLVRSLVWASVSLCQLAVCLQQPLP